MPSGALGSRRLVGSQSLKFQRDPCQFIGRGKHSPRKDKLDRIARVIVWSVEQADEPAGAGAGRRATAEQRKKPAKPHGSLQVLTLGYRID